MNYFPAFIKLKKKKILIVGGGKIAHDKLLHLLDFSQNISVISLTFSDDMMQSIDTHALSYEKRAYKSGDIKDVALVIVAVDNIKVQKEIFEESQNYKCLCNAVDSVEYCDFIFPSYVKKNDLTIAISTSGSSPALAKYLKYYFEKLIPQSISIFLQEMKVLRETLPKGRERMKLLDEKAKKYIDKL